MFGGNHESSQCRAMADGMLVGRLAVPQAGCLVQQLHHSQSRSGKMVRPCRPDSAEPAMRRHVADGSSSN
jgi:hypothetical protein